jgi:hypothetical protein
VATVVVVPTGVVGAVVVPTVVVGSVVVPTVVVPTDVVVPVPLENAAGGVQGAHCAFGMAN